jgi:hypothetical protein
VLEQGDVQASDVGYLEGKFRLTYAIKIKETDSMYGFFLPLQENCTKPVDI